MEPGIVTSDKYDLVREAVSETKKLRSRAEKFLTGMMQVAKEQYPRENWGMRFDRSLDGSVVMIETPYGIARATIVVSVGEKGTQATILFEKSGYDERDRKTWRPVWKINATNDGYYAGVDYSNKMNTDPFNAENMYAEALLSALYSIAKW